MEDMGYGMHDGDMEGGGMQSVGGWMQDMVYGLQWNVGSWVQDIGYGMYDMGCRTQIMRHWK